MSFVAALATLGETAAMTAMLGEGALAAGTAANTIGAGMLAGASIGAGTQGIANLATGQDFTQGMGEAAGIGGLTGGVFGGLGAAGDAATAAENAAGAGQTLTGAANTTAEGVQAVSSPIAQSAPTAGSANAFFQGASNPALAQTGSVMSSPIGQAGITAQNAASGLASPGTSMLGQAGQAWNAASPMTRAGIEGLTGLGLSSALSNTDQAPTAPGIKYPNIDPNKYRYSQPQWSVYQPTYMAAGGITDIDGYMSNAQNVPQDVKVPNPIDVANPTGYLGNSVQSYAHGGIADLGSYRSGGSPNLLHDNGPSRKNDGISDGVSDDIEATIAGKQPARLASGEYVLSSRIVSELGNGSTDAGAKRLDQMVKRIQAGRNKTVGKNKEYAKDTKAYKHLPV